MRGQSGRVTQRCHNSPKWETGLQSANDLTHRKRAEDLGRFWKSQLVELRTGHWTRQLTFACSRRPLWRVPHVLGRRRRWKSQNTKIVPLSPYVEEPLNSKEIKSFVPELRSRKSFSCFEIPMFYLYEHSMYVSHIAISWLWYTTSLSSFLHIVKWFQVLVYNRHYLASVICLHTVCSIWPIERTLSCATNPGQSGPGSNGSGGVLYIP